MVPTGSITAPACAAATATTSHTRQLGSMQATISHGSIPEAVIRVPIRRPAETTAPSVDSPGRTRDGTVREAAGERAGAANNHRWEERREGKGGGRSGGCWW